MNFKKHIWRILQPVLLGTISNIIINYIFSPLNPDFIWNEFLFAILLAIPITELNRIIDIKLEKTLSWIKEYKKRFFYHLVLLLAITVFILNIIGYIYFKYKNIDLEELIIINIVAFAISLLLTILTWSAHFCKNWISAEKNLHQTNEQLDKLILSIKSVHEFISLGFGKKQFKIPAEEIRFAIIELGIVRVWATKSRYGIFNDSLTSLQKLLPEHLFFLINRKIIIHRDIIKSVSSSTFGKINIEIDNNETNNNIITVSRQKASRFRNWYNSTST